jgi:hypothetical protein
MFPDARARRLAGIFGTLSLLCPVTLVIIVLLMRAGVFHFHDDFTGFKGVGFFLGWGIGLLPAGTLAGAVALLIDRSSWLARSGAALNALLLTGFLLVLAQLWF